jgi:hypothetical protein
MMKETCSLVVTVHPSAASSSMVHCILVRNIEVGRFIFVVARTTRRLVIGDIGLTLGVKHLLERLPDIGGMLNPMNMRENLRGEQLEEVVEDNMIPGDPDVVLGILHRLHGFLSVGSTTNVSGRSSIGAVPSR